MKLAPILVMTILSLMSVASAVETGCFNGLVMIQPTCEDDIHCGISACPVEVVGDFCEGPFLVDYNHDGDYNGYTIDDECMNQCVDSCYCVQCEPDCSEPEPLVLCSQGYCGAECEEDSDCCDGDSSTADYCIGCMCVYEEEPNCAQYYTGEEGTCAEPGQEDSEYCHQCPIDCLDHYLATRDEWGYCDDECGCIEDEWQLECSIGDCGAQCAGDDDCDGGTCEDCMCVYECDDPFCERDGFWGGGHEFMCNQDGTYEQCNEEGDGYDHINECAVQCGSDVICDGYGPSTMLGTWDEVGESCYPDICDDSCEATDCPECDYECDDCEQECDECGDGCDEGCDDCGGCDECDECDEECEGDCNEAPYIITVPETWYRVGESYHYDVDAIDPDGDVVYYSLIEAPEDMVIDQSSGMIEWQPEDDMGTVCVAVIAEDGDGAYDMQGYCMDASSEDEQYPRRKLKIETIRMDYQVFPYVFPGDQMWVDINFRNTGTYDVDRSQVRFTLPELGLSRQVGMFDGPDVDEALRRGTIFDLPEGAEPGVYTMRTSVYTEDGIRRTRHREFVVVE
jgi:hypothetical protein